MLLNEPWTITRQWRILLLQESIPFDIKITASAFTLLLPFVSPATDLEGRKVLHKLQLFQALPTLPLYLGSPRLTQAWGWSWRRQDKLSRCSSCQFKGYAVKFMHQYSFVPNESKKPDQEHHHQLQWANTWLCCMDAMLSQQMSSGCCLSCIYPASCRVLCSCESCFAVSQELCSFLLPCKVIRMPIRTGKTGIFPSASLQIQSQANGNGIFTHPNTRLPLDLLVCPLHSSVILPSLTNTFCHSPIILSKSSKVTQSSGGHCSFYPPSFGWACAWVCNYTYPNIRPALQGFPLEAAMEMYPAKTLHCISKVPLVRNF